MEGGESTPFYHRSFTSPNHSHNHNHNPINNPNNNDNKLNPSTNAVYRAGCERAMVSLEQPISISNNNTNTHDDNASSSSHLYSECKNPSAMFAHAVSERAGIGIGMAGPDSFKRKRGRPRKYGTAADGFGTMGLPLSPFSPEKKGVGSGKKAQMVALGIGQIMKLIEDIQHVVSNGLSQGLSPTCCCPLISKGMNRRRSLMTFT